MDGVRDYSVCLAHALRTAGHDAQCVDWVGEGADVALLQYSPFAWGRKGVSPGLVWRVWRCSANAHPPILAIMVHEPFVIDGRLRDRFRGRLQRAQLLALCRLVDHVLVSIQPWAALLAHWQRDHRVVHLPVGSNLPDGRARRTETRALLGLAPSEVVLAAFDSRHPGRSSELLEVAANAAAGAGATTLLLLGAEARPSGISRLRVVRPGSVSALKLAGHLAAADIFLAPFVDGVSTRRTTLIAALQHGIPVVGTKGHLTDPCLLGGDRGMVLAPVDDHRSFAALTGELVGDSARREFAGRQARTFFEAEFAWPVLVARLTAALD
jgi:hypothetical protein